MKLKFGSILFLFMIGQFVVGQPNDHKKDSLLKNWNDHTLSDSIRFESMQTFNWDYILFNDPDSSLLISAKLMNFVAEKKMNRQLRGIVLSNVGIAQTLLADYKSALETYDETLNIFKELNNPGQIATILSHISIVYNYLGELDKSTQYSELSLAQREEMNDSSGLASSLNNHGALYFQQGNYDKAIEVFTRSLAMNEKMGKKKNISQAYNNIGIVYMNLDEYEKAIEYYDLCIEIAEELGDLRQKSSCYNNLARIYFEKKVYDSALVIYEKCMVMNKALNDRKSIAHTYLNIGITQKHIGLIDSAVVNLVLAIEKAKEIGAKHVLLDAKISYSQIHLDLGDNQKALEEANDAYRIAMEINSLKFINRASSVLWKVHDRIGNRADAFTYLLKYSESKDSLATLQNKEELVRQQLSYEYQKKSFADSLENAKQQKLNEAIITAQKEQLSKERIQRVALYGGLFLVALFLIVVYNRFRVIRKQKLVIEEKERIAIEQKELVEEKNKEILDSINYAKRLQNAILPPKKFVDSLLAENFILYIPKDIVAGDFYFVDSVELGDQQLIYIVAADCTGHGVPGAMVSIVGANAIKRCIQELGLQKPGEILDKLSKMVAANFSQSEETIRDGMDIALCCIEKKEGQIKKVHYAGANNPLWVINPNRIVVPENGTVFKEGGGFEIKGNKQAIGYTENIVPFTTHSFDAEAGDTLYTFSDGFADQFGGEHLSEGKRGGKKYKSTNLRKFLLDIYNKEMEEQKKMINEEFDNWKGDLEQIDDVCVIGVRF
jgi:tetratricopeptide (TPR) repeat protein